MKKIIFFNHPLIFEENKDIFEMQEKFIRYGILSLATYLKSKGYPVKVIDQYQLVNEGTADEIKNKLIKFKPDFVAIPSFTTEIYNADKTAAFVKKFFGNKVKVIIGGPHLSALPRETMNEFANFDIGVIGEGELILEEIVKGKRLADIEGIIYRKENGEVVQNQPRKNFVDINKLPSPKYELFDLEKYVQPVYAGFLRQKRKILVLPLETTRGCPCSCKFCFRTVGRQARLKNPKKAVKEIKELIQKYRIDRIDVIDGTFGISKEHALKICKLLKEEGLNKKIKWSVMVRANTLDGDIAKALKMAGCFYIGIGVEAGSDRVLEKSGKGITTEQIRKVIILAQKQGIEVHSYFILGLPYETEKDIKETAEFAKSLPVVGANFAILVPFPGTEIYSLAKAKKMGYRLATNDYRLFGKQEGSALINKNLSYKKLKELQRYCYKKFYLSSPKRFLVFLSHLNFKRLFNITRFLLVR